MLNKLLELLGLVLLLFINFTKSQHGDFLDYISSPPQRGERNLTCIAHDTKFTCDCRNADETIFLQPLNGHVYHISISNCKRLSVASYAISNTQGLRSLSFTNVENLVLQENSLAFPRFTSHTPLILEFNKFSLNEIQSHAINGNIEEIVFTSGKIGTIRPFAITSLQSRAVLLKFNDVRIDRIEPQAFKKFSVEDLEFSNSAIMSSLPSKSLYELEILQHFKVHNTTFKEVYSKAFLFKAISNIILTENHFKKVDGEWIEAPILHAVMIRSNQFGYTSPYAFRTISVHKDYTSNEKMELRFINNTIQQENEISPIEFNNTFQLIVKDLFFVSPFNCRQAEKASEKSFFKTFSDTIYFKSDKQHGGKYTSLSKLLETDCIEPSYWTYIVAGVVSFILLVLIVAGILIYLYMKKRKKRKLDIIVPEPRTYRETQIVLQIENAGLLKTDL